MYVHMLVYIHICLSKDKGEVGCTLGLLAFVITKSGIGEGEQRGGMQAIISFPLYIFVLHSFICYSKIVLLFKIKKYNVKESLKRGKYQTATNTLPNKCAFPQFYSCSQKHINTYVGFILYKN